MPKKVPTLLGLVLLAILIGGFIFISERLFRTPSSATASDTPAHVTVTNVTDASFTVTWDTQRPTTGAIEIRDPTGKKRVLFDERDVAANTLGKYPTHSVPVRSLAASTPYTFTVLSNGRPFQNAGTAYRAQTAPQLDPPTTGLGPAYGTIETDTNQPAAGALVFLNLEGGQPLSALVKPSGSWLIPLNLVRSQDLTQYLAISDRMTETIAVSLNDQTTSAITDTLNDAPVPTMILGKSYDFRKQQANAAVGTPLADQAVRPSILGDQTASQPSIATVTLASPADGASLTTTVPLIEGTGVPGKAVSITIGITQPVSGSTTVGADGMWRYTPLSPLAMGKQSVTITTPNTQGQPVAITHAFEILKSGTQVLGVATPSATLNPTPLFTPTPTSTLAGQPVPVSGNFLPLMLLVAGALTMIATGSLALVW